MWSKIDDRYADHPKIREAGPHAAWLNTVGINYCSRYLTDGFIPERMVSTLADFDGCGVKGPKGWRPVKVMDLVDTLVEVNLWERCEGGYMIHDYLDYNPPKAQVVAEREKGNERARNRRTQDKTQGATTTVCNAVTNGVSNGVTNGVTNGVSNGVTNSVTNGVCTGAPYPYPSPNPNPSRNAPSTGVEGAARAERGTGAAPAADRDHPAVQRYHEVTRLWPTKGQAKAIIETVTDLDEWEKCLRAWDLKGYNPRNVADMLDRYGNGSPEHGGRTANRGNGRGRKMDNEIFTGRSLDSVPPEFRDLVQH